MDCVGIDLHLRHTQVAILTDEGELIERRIQTSRPKLTEFFGGRSRARILVEASTESEWVAQVLEEAGHEVIVADPGYAPMYARRSRNVKTDRRDAQALAEACRLEVYRRAHRLSVHARRLRAQVRVRQELVQTRTRFILRIRALLRQEGVRIPPGSAATFAHRVQSLSISPSVREAIEPFLVLLEPINAQIAVGDRELDRLCRTDTVMRRLCTVPGVGPVTAASFVCVIDRVDRFRSARAVRSYLGLVPRERSSGEKIQRGRITKVGNRWMRSTLIQAAWGAFRSSGSEAGLLKDWMESIALRRGRRRAIVALARKMAGILFALWRDECDFDPCCLSTEARTQAA
jgi:transposase